MAGNYTIQLREVINLYGLEEVTSWFTAYELSDYLLQNQIKVIEESGMWSKEKLAKKIINHYFMREIGLETPALFRHFAKEKMQEIMEEKLPFIYTNSVAYDPFVNENYTETFERDTRTNGTAQGNSNSSSNSSGLGVNSDTPQGEINKQNILKGQYASSTNASDSEATDTTETNSTTTGTGKETYSRHVEGNRGVSSSYQVLIELYRKNVRALDKEIIKELNSLFMGLY